MSGPFSPDPSQLAAIDIDPETRQIVIAGAGAGKTQVVAALAGRLMDEVDLDPFAELLVLSFSRAAVHAAVGRMRAWSEGGPIPTPRTLDSLATAIMLDCGLDPTGQQFDTRIINARKALERREWEPVRDLQHVIIDEVQDVVGVRADFVLELLRSVDPSCGFTLLGDPAQSIYDFQLGPQSATTAADLLSAARTLRVDQEVVLSGQYRAEGRKVRAAIDLREAAIDPNRAARTLRDFEDDLPRDQDLATFARAVPHMPGRTVFLTATNGDALMVAESLADAGLRTVLRRSALERAVDGRIAAGLADHPTQYVSREEFDSLSVFGDQGDAVWRALRRASSTYGAKVDLRELTSTLSSSSRVPEELLAEDDERFVVSTIHRAKGLEFDNVVLLAGRPREDEDPAGWARTRYVAVTRARRLIAAVDRPRSWFLSKDDRRGRWYEPVNRGRWPRAIEMRGDDIDRAAPHGGRSAQDRIRGQIRPGDPVDLRLDPDRSTLDAPLYEVVHGGLPVGRTSDEFGALLAGWVGSARRRDREYLPWPRLEGVRVESVETVCGDVPSAGDVGRWGVWSGVRLGGLARLRWKAEQ